MKSFALKTLVASVIAALVATTAFAQSAPPVCNSRISVKAETRTAEAEATYAAQLKAACEGNPACRFESQTVPIAATEKTRAGIKHQYRCVAK